MGGRGLRVRVLGFASTSRGFGFAVLEGTSDLVDWGLRRTPATEAGFRKALEPVLRRGQASLVVVPEVRGSLKRWRGRTFHRTLIELARRRGVPVESLPRSKLEALSSAERPTQWDVAYEVSRRFPEVALRLPKPRRLWQSEDDRIGLFLAIGTALAVWQRVQRDHPR